MKRLTLEDFINEWIEEVLVKGFTFDFFNDSLVHKDIPYIGDYITPDHLSTRLLESVQSTELQHEIYTVL